MTFYEANPRYDLLTGELIGKCAKEKYLSTFFANRNNMKTWFRQTDKLLAAKQALEMLATRNAVKKLQFVPSEVELRTSPLPTASLLLSVGVDYNEIARKSGLEQRFNYCVERLPEFLPRKMKIICDTREQLPLDCWPENIETERKKLNYGDYAPQNNPDKLYVERKSLGDCLGSLSAKNFPRICREIERAQKDGAYLFFLVDCSFSEFLSFKYSYAGKHLKASEEYIFSQLREIMQTYPNVQFVFSGSREQSAKFIEYVFGLGSRSKSYDWQALINSKTFVLPKK